MNRKYLNLVLLMVLSGCAVGPDYKRPEVAVPAAFKETWKVAKPQDALFRGNWWEMYQDPDLNLLVAEVKVSNQNIAAAEAQYREALALLDQARAAYFPVVSAATSGTRTGGISSLLTNGGAVNAVKLSLSASWEPDLWGNIRRTVEANAATAEASEATLQGALLSAQSTLVQSYLQLRVTDALARMLDENIAAYKRSLQITQDRFEAGVAARLDVAQAETQLKSAEAQRIDLGVQRSQYEHAIAVLIGKAPADFSIGPKNAVPAVPDIPGTVPSELLERRPDIAAAERNMAAANAQIGVAKSAFFPTLTLSASSGYQNTSLYNLTTMPNRLWSLGPSAALTLFDAGARSALEDKAIATYDQMVAAYRQTVLSAFQNVEDNLSAMRVYEQEVAALKSAENLASESLEITKNQYDSGTVSYLNVVTAEATALSASESRINTEGKQLVASAVLLAALGGGWHAPQ